MPISGEFRSTKGYYQRLAESGMILNAPDYEPNIPIIVEADAKFLDIPTLPWGRCRVPMHEECTFGQLTTLVKRMLKAEEARLAAREDGKDGIRGKETADQRDEDEAPTYNEDEKISNVFLMLNGDVPVGKWETLRHVYDKYADKDGWLYVTYATQAAEPVVATNASWAQVLSAYAWQPVGFLVRLVRK